jgi:hypothetical protein
MAEWESMLSPPAAPSDAGRTDVTDAEEATVTTRQAIEAVLTDKRKPMRVPAIIAAGVPLATGLRGKTPGQVFYSTIYAESKKPDGLVVQTGRGEFKLNPKRRRP